MTAFITDAHPGASTAAPATAWMFSQTGVLARIHHWGTENDPAFKHHDGHALPQGFGRRCFSVPDLDVAFIKDSHGYWIESVEPGRLMMLGR